MSLESSFQSCSRHAAAFSGSPPFKWKAAACRNSLTCLSAYAQYESFQ